MKNGEKIVERERVEWELPAALLKDLRNYCETYTLPECETVCRAIKRYLAERLLEEGE